MASASALSSLLPSASSGPHESGIVPRRAAGARGPTHTLPYRLGRYTLFDHIGRGGMADIYLASARTGLGGSRLVVIKEVLAELADRARFAEMLVAEAKLAARLCHANVVKVEDLGREQGTLFIAMEYVEGFDLRDLLRRCARDKVALPIEFSLLVVSEALRALDYAHRFRDERGQGLCVVHRDVSPSNVLISFEGEIKLCDFGIARANDTVETLPDEAIQGKAGYMSPEHARGEAIDARADVFAAGIILWELLSGRRLYKAADGESLLEVAQRAEIPPVAVHGLHDEQALHAIVLRALAPSRDDRYLAAAGMLRDLEEYAATARMVASPIRFGEWLMTHFGRDVVAERRGRERALRALERGPAVILNPLSPVGRQNASLEATDEPKPLPRGLVAPGPIAVRSKSSRPPPPERRPRLEDLSPPPSLPGLARDLDVGGDGRHRGLAVPSAEKPATSWVPHALAIGILLLGLLAYFAQHAGR